MRKLIILILLAVCSINVTYSQKYIFKRHSVKKERHRIFLSIGATNFLGDLGGANKIGSNKGSLRDFDAQALKPGFQFGYMYRISKAFSWRSAFTYAWLSGNDVNTKEPFRQNRNLNFRTAIYDLSTVFEAAWDINSDYSQGHQFSLKGIKGGRNISVTPYAYAGIAVNYFNPKGNYNGQWYALQPLCTEGEGLVPTRKKYSLVQITIPIGAGVRVKLTKSIEVGIEYSGRIGFTDYIDDVSTTYFDKNALSVLKGETAALLANPTLNNIPGATDAGQQRGNPRNNDSWLTVMVSMYYTLGRSNSPHHRRR